MFSLTWQFNTLFISILQENENHQSKIYPNSKLYIYLSISLFGVLYRNQENFTIYEEWICNKINTKQWRQDGLPLTGNLNRKYPYLFVIRKNVKSACRASQPHRSMYPGFPLLGNPGRACLWWNPSAATFDLSYLFCLHTMFLPQYCCRIHPVKTKISALRF